LRKVGCLFLFLLLVFASSVSAHTGLKEANPDEGKIVTDGLKEIVLTFDTEVENGSAFALFHESGEEVALHTFRNEGAKLIGVVEEPLEDGEYTIKWSIVGEDGHFVSGEYSFTVDVAEKAEEEPEPPGGTEGEEEQNLKSEAPEETEADSSDDTAEADQEGTSLLETILRGVLLFAALAVVIWLVRRERR